MRVLFNVLWHVPGMGFLSALLAFLIGLVLTATVVAAPIGLGLVEYGKFLLAPFTRRMIRREDVAGKYKSKTWRIWSTLTRIVYFPLGIVLLVLGLVNIVLSLIIVLPTIFGIALWFPQAYTIANSLMTLLNPVGRKSIHYLVAEEMDRIKAKEELEKLKKESQLSTVEES